MKRYGHIFPQLLSFEHLLTAFRRAYRGSGKNREAQIYDFDREPRLLALRRQLADGSYQPSPYRYFRIYDPKERMISVAPFEDRIVHHAVVGVLEPIFEPVFIHDSYATRKGKGTHKAILRSQFFLRRNRWFLKMDMDKYFDSVDQEKLLDLIGRKIKDPDLMALIGKIIRNGGSAGKGLPIGNLTSQFFANVYLNPLDHYVKETLGVKAYVRYMDDFVGFGLEKSRLKEARKEIIQFLDHELGLRPKPGSVLLNQRDHGLSFLGARVFSDTIRMHPANLSRNRRRLAQSIKGWEQGKLSEEQFVQSLESRWAHLSWFDSYHLRQKLVRDLWK